jgi:nitroimidazol reductase NimA-like FMN-containing flavoprotein (pyridoxamine 5'-phosphate oxidase superfamily)
MYDVDMSATAHERGIEFLEIDRDVCMRMLAAASGGVGRIALSVSPVMIRPVNFAFDDQTQSVVFRSALGSKLREGLCSGSAAFEIDGTDPVDRAGWSVIIVGEAEEVSDPAEIEQLEDFELESWDPGVKTHWVRIRATSASGRRIVRDINCY